MTITRVNPAGWTDATDTVTAAQLNQLDTNATYAADFAAGGTYAPSAAVIVGGSGIQLSGTSRLGLASRSLTIVQPLIGSTCATGDNFEYLSSSGAIRNNAGTGAQIFLLLTRMPDGATLTNVRLYYKGATGHAGPDPITGQITMPNFTVVYRDVSSVAATAIGTTTDDPEVVQATYEAVHGWAADGVSAAAHVINQSNNYGIIFTAETGGDYQANGTITGVVTTCTITEQQEF